MVELANGQRGVVTGKNGTIYTVLPIGGGKAIKVPASEIIATVPSATPHIDKYLPPEKIAERAYKAEKREKSLAEIGKILDYLLPRAGASPELATPEGVRMPGGEALDMTQGIHFSKAQFPDGKLYTKVDTDQHLFDGKPKNEYSKIARKIILDKFRNQVIGVKANDAFVNRASADEYAYPAKTVMGDIRDAKMRASAELNNLLETSEFVEHRKYDSENPDPNHPKGNAEWDIYRTIFQVGDRYFSGNINIKYNKYKNGKVGKLFYDITKIKDITDDIIGQYEKTSYAETVSDTFAPSITTPRKTVKNTGIRAEESVAEFLENKGAGRKKGAQSIGGDVSQEVRKLLEQLPRPTEEEIQEIGVDYRMHEGYNDDWKAYNEKASYRVEIPGTTKEAADLAAHLCRWTVKNGARTQDEFGALIDISGKGEPYRERGTKEGVGNDTGFWERIGGSLPDTQIFIHNHLNNKTFSLQDLRLALGCKSIHTILAAGHDGKVYMTSGIRHMLEKGAVDDIIAGYERAGRLAEKLEKLKKLLDDGKIITGQEQRMREELYVREILKDYFGVYKEVDT